MNVICRLGGFHTMMSFLSSIGSMMKGSGLEDVLENAYAPKAITHMISGKAVSKALHGHFLIKAALMNKLMLRVLPYIDNENDTVNPSGVVQETMEESAFGQNCLNNRYCNEMDILLFEASCNKEMPPDETGSDLDLQDKLDVTEVEKICSLYEGVKVKTMPVSDVAESQELIELQNCIYKQKLKSSI